MRAWSMLGRRTIATLWVGQVLSSIGDYFYNIGIIWTAARLAGTDAGLVAASQAISVLVFGMLGGVIADRFDRRRSMIAADLLRAVAVAALPISAAFGALGIGQLVLVAVVLGALDAVFVPALLASLPAIVDDAAELQATNGLMDSTRRIARAIGPGVAGLVALHVSVPNFFTVDALSFLASAGALASIAGRHGWAPTPSVRAGAPRGLRGVFADMGDALRLVWQNRPVSWAFGALFIVNATWCAGFYIGSVFLASRVLGGDVDAFAFIIAAYGVGNIAGNLVITNSFTRRKAHGDLLGQESSSCCAGLLLAIARARFRSRCSARRSLPSAVRSGSCRSSRPSRASSRATRPAGSLQPPDDGRAGRRRDRARRLDGPLRPRRRPRRDRGLRGRDGPHRRRRPPSLRRQPLTIRIGASSATYGA